MLELEIGRETATPCVDAPGSIPVVQEIYMMILGAKVRQTESRTDRSVKRRALSSSFHSSKPERVKAPQKAQCTTYHRLPDEWVVLQQRRTVGGKRFQKNDKRLDALSLRSFQAYRRISTILCLDSPLARRNKLPKIERKRAKRKIGKNFRVYSR